MKKEYSQNYGLTLYTCTNEPEVCDFMSNKLDCLKDIYKCERCRNGYMIVKLNSKTGQFFFCCTSYNTVGIRCKIVRLFIRKHNSRVIQPVHVLKKKSNGMGEIDGKTREQKQHHKASSGEQK